jgi:hypothetical protein
MWPTVAKIALLTFLAVAVLVFAVVYLRKSRAKGFPTSESSSHFDQARGAMPPTPKPAWVDDLTNDDDQPPRADSA